MSSAAAASPSLLSKGHRLIDIGANLTDEMFHGKYNHKQEHPSDFDKMLERAKNAGVERIIITSSYLEDARDAMKILNVAAKVPSPDMFITAGVHPTRCKKFEQSGNGEKYLADIKKLILAHPGKVVAIGECGLDYDRLHFCDKPTQIKWFERQFELAESTHLPLFLHSRNTGSDFVDMIKRNRNRFKHGVVHSFTGTWEEAEQLLAMGLYLGVNGCSLKTPENIAVVAKIPLDRMMLETDAPWCSIKTTHASYKHVRTHFPQRKRENYVEGFTVKDRSEPCHMQQVLEVVAAIHGVSEDDLAKIVHANTITFLYSLLKKKPN